MWRSNPPLARIPKSTSPVQFFWTGKTIFPPEQLTDYFKEPRICLSLS
jgi:hypothetical protein